jgi:hypothetical protein
MLFQNKTMKKALHLLSSSLLLLLFAPALQAQLVNDGLYIHISNGSFVVATNGLVNTNGGTITNDGDLLVSGDLANESGAALQGDGQYQVEGDWTNSATFDAGTSTVTFDGNANSTVTSGGDAFYNLRLNKAGANLLLGDELTVQNLLDFQAAGNYVILGSYDLVAENISGNAANRHIRTTGLGALVRTVGNSPVFFPVGNNTYNPATLTNVGTTDQLSVRVIDGVYDAGASGQPFAAGAVNRTWLVEEATPGDLDLTLTVQWNGSEELSSFDRTQSYIGHYTGGNWDMSTETPANGDDPYTQTRSGIVSLSPFAVFGANASILIVEAGDPQTICQSKAVDLTAIGASITPANFAGAWTTSGDGTFDDTNTGTGVYGVATTYFLGNADIQNGEVLLILEANGISDQAPIAILRVGCGVFPWNGN